MGDLAKCWVDQIEWLGYATRANQLVTIKYCLAVAKPPCMRS